MRTGACRPGAIVESDHAANSYRLRRGQAGAPSAKVSAIRRLRFRCGMRTEDSVDPLVAAVQQRIKDWGIAGRGCIGVRSWSWK